VAVDARALADPAGGGPLTAILLALALVLTAPSAAALDVRGEDYRAAASAGRLGAVSGRAFEEPRRRGASDTPIGGFGVTLLPRSEEFLGRLAGIRAATRTDMKVYRTSASRIVGARGEYERALAAAGDAEFVQYVPVTADGEFHFDGVPAGAWLVIGVRPVFVPKSSGKPSSTKPKEKDLFAPQPRLKGYYTVSVWVREVTVEPGGVARVTLTDRNAWMTAIEEERVLDAGH
jgi:hypothetical protein